MVSTTSPEQSRAAAAVLRDLKNRLKILEDERERILTAIAVIEGVPIGAAVVLSVHPVDAESKGIQESPKDSKEIYAGMSITDAAIHFLKGESGPQKTAEITRAIIAGGQKSESKNPYRMVYNALKHRSNTRKDIKLTEDSMWVLKR